MVDSSSFGGESGAPVVAWEGGDVLVIGVITSMHRQTDKTKTPLEERISHMPLGVGHCYAVAVFAEAVGILIGGQNPV